MKLMILAQSSSGGNYPVDFSDDSDVLRVFCHCQAGTLQQMYKHKLALLKDDRKMLYNLAQEEILKEVLSSPSYAVLKRRLDKHEKQLEELGREMEKLKDQEKTLKSDFAYEIAQGHKRG
ncbi:MAG: hypothetical protein HY033_10505 [Ignavibacteriae bacterium]|nr:hypothetical protein [Ignavibacteria bacterium]MBI3365328.1 hypothetical protein [Ignavibacteriota bacterium]